MLHFPSADISPDTLWEVAHQHYYDSRVWEANTWGGLRCWKLPTDAWRYQELICQLQPSLIVELGRGPGGSTRFFHSVAQLLPRPPHILSVDIVPPDPYAHLEQLQGVTLKVMSSTDPYVGNWIATHRTQSPLFAILDSDHRAPHVLAELELLRHVTLPGDVVAIEDTNINGHPVLPEHGPGPAEALQAYQEAHPGDYTLLPALLPFSFATLLTRTQTP